MAGLQGAALFCLWVLQRVALKRAAWPDVIDSQLAGNALAKIAPAGGALGAALQYRMLVQAGLERGRAVAGLTAANVLTFAIVLSLPLLVVPAIIRGGVQRSLVEATGVGLVVFRSCWRPAWPCSRSTARSPGSAGRAAHSQPVAASRSAAHQPATATAYASGIGCSALWVRAGSEPCWRGWVVGHSTTRRCWRPWRRSGHTRARRSSCWRFVPRRSWLRSQSPLAGSASSRRGSRPPWHWLESRPGDAVLATLAYRLFSYWLPLPLGLVGAVVHRRRYGRGALES